MPTGGDRIVAMDTSVAVPLLVQTHTAHRLVVDWWQGRRLTLSGHALVETYSVLTRLPGDIRLAPRDAARLVSERFEAPLMVKPADARRLPDTFANLGIAGGAAHDALVALAAMSNRCRLATRDARALATYEAVGVDVIIVG